MSEKKEKTRRRILESAGSSSKESGISGTSVAGVMDGAGMTVGGFYAHFESKQEMVTEALASSLGEALDTLVAGLDDKSGSEWIIARRRQVPVRSAQGLAHPRLSPSRDRR